jgi:translocation and assembly module TamB
MKWLWRALALLVLLALLAGLGAYSLLRTEFGVRLVLAQVGADQLRFAALSGSLATGLQIDDLQAQWPAAQIEAQRIRLRLRPARLWHGEVHIDTLATRGLVITPSASEAPPSPTRPGKLDLPVAIVVRNVDLAETGIDTGAEALLRFSLAARQVELRDGKLGIDGIALRIGDALVRLQGDSDSGQSWASRIDSETEMPVNATTQRARVGVAGDLDALNVEADINEGAITLSAEVADVLGSGSTDGKLAASGVDPREFGLDLGIAALDLDLEFGWRDNRASIAGQARVDGQSFDIAVIDLGLANAQLQLGQLALASPDHGRLQLSGTWPLAADAPPGSLLVELDNAALADWRLAAPANAPRSSARGTLGGTLDAWQLALAGPLLVADQSLASSLQLRGDATAIDVDSLSIANGAAQLVLDGQWVYETQRFAGQLSVQDWLLDPYLPDWPGQLRGSIDVDLRLGEGVQWTAITTGLEGRLREAPFSLRADLSGRDAALDAGSAALRWGEGGVELAVPASQRLDLRFDAFELSLLTNRLRGTVSGSASTDLAASDPIDALNAALSGTAWVYDDVSIGALRIDKSSGWNARIEALELRQGERQADTELALQGSAENHRLALSFVTAGLRVDAGAAGAADLERGTWRGSIDALQVAPDRLPRFSLQAPSAVELADGSYRIEPICVAAAAASACIGVAQAESLRIDIDLSDLPLALAQPLLPGDAFELGGALSGGGQLDIGAEAGLAGQLSFRIAGGTLKGASEFEAPIAFDATASLDAATRRIEARLNLPSEGYIDAVISDWLSDAALLVAELRINDLALAETVTPEVQSIRGALAGSLRVPLQAPQQLSGELTASRLAFELPSVGLKIGGGNMVGRLAENALTLDGELAIAPGKVAVDGRVALDGSAAELRLRADNAGLVDLPAIRLAGDTDLIVKLDRDGASAEGGVLLRDGRIYLDRFAPTVPASEDVVIVDAPPPPPPLPVRAEVSVAFIQQVDLRGYGLNATLGGGLRLTQSPGKRPRATGEMLIAGTYQAYGQRLDIERGRLRFTGGVADNPALDILAAKSVQRQRVGVEVRGRAKRPLIQLYSDPQLDQSEALSYLVLGRPITTANADDSARVGEYADALESAGGSLIAGSIGQRLGLAAGIESLGSSIGSALVVGKYLSPRFFIGYGSSLLEAIQLVILRYRVTESIEVEGISGNEQKASVSWRIER